MTLTELVERRNEVKTALAQVESQIVEHVEMQRRMLDGVVADIAGKREKSDKRGLYRRSAESREKASAAMRARWASAKANGTRVNASSVQ